MRGVSPEREAGAVRVGCLDAQVSESVNGVGVAVVAGAVCVRKDFERRPSRRIRLSRESSAATWRLGRIRGCLARIIHVLKHSHSPSVLISPSSCSPVLIPNRDLTALGTPRGPAIIGSAATPAPGNPGVNPVVPVTPPGGAVGNNTNQIDTGFGQMAALTIHAFIVAGQTRHELRTFVCRQSAYQYPALHRHWGALTIMMQCPGPCGGVVPLAAMMSPIADTSWNRVSF